MLRKTFWICWSLILSTNLFAIEKTELWNAIELTKFHYQIPFTSIENEQIKINETTLGFSLFSFCLEYMEKVKNWNDLSFSRAEVLELIQLHYAKEVQKLLKNKPNFLCLSKPQTMERPKKIEFIWEKERFREKSE